jgi:hypothetical protein
MPYDCDMRTLDGAHPMEQILTATGKVIYEKDL